MTSEEPLTFPDGPRGELDGALADLISQAERVRAAQGRLRELLRGVQHVVEDIELATVLRNVVDAARELVQAEYGALGVIDAEGHELDQFIFSGMSADAARDIGHLPRGRGLLGALIAEPHHIRLQHLHDDPRAVGFPPDHPPMESFLGVPIRIRGEVFGNLYLTNQKGGAFSAEDEQLVEALASTAGVAIQNARLFEEARLREAWMNASAELSSALLSAPLDEALDLIAARVFDVSGAARALILVPIDAGGRMRVAAARGTGEDEIRGASIERAGEVVDAALSGGKPRAEKTGSSTGSDPIGIVVDARQGPVLAVPLQSRQRVWGVLVLARQPGEPAFTTLDSSVAGRLASQASIALELAHARTEQQRRMLSDERSRIAQDLHDHVIQQLFAAGLTLQSVRGGMSEGREEQRLGDVARQVDDAITQIRTVIFALSAREGHSVRHRLIDVVAELSPLLDRPPTVRFGGAVDHLITGDLADDAVAVARELLTNTVRHSGADDIRLDVTAHDATLIVAVQDDGSGITSDRRSGLANLADRAASRGGELQVDSTQSGTRAVWQVPIPSAQEATP